MFCIKFVNAVKVKGLESRRLHMAISVTLR